ncbi:MAG TPA: serine/threonine-protein kinase [Acidobacteriaceae bacterium]|nr:serine/threonine-protein kinase [Acidobacteriaceae bacterium]
MSASATLEPGQQLDHFRIDACIAESGMASIYRATDVRDGRLVAIKLPHASAEADPTLAERFRREEEIGTTLDHPNVMRTFPAREASRPYLVMEWVPGRLLRRILADEGKLPQERAIRIVSGILEALAYIHQRGVVHRDLKPDNIMVDERDHVKLIDFGIASKQGARRITYTGFSPALGTPDYIAPEQVQGKRGDQRSDLYAAGVMLYEMLTGKVPFSGPSPLAAMNERLLRPPVPPREVNPSISAQLQEVIYRALEREPRNRYANAEEFLLDLRHLDRVGVSERDELTDWRRRGSGKGSRSLIWIVLILIPLLLFVAMLLLAHRF